MWKILMNKLSQIVKSVIYIYIQIVKAIFHNNYLISHINIFHKK